MDHTTAIIGALGVAVGALFTYLVKSREVKNQFDLTRDGNETARETTLLDRWELKIVSLENHLKECGEKVLKLTANEAVLLERAVASGVERVRLAAENAALIARGKNLERQVDSNDPSGLVARVEIDVKGIICEWNYAAVKMFGWGSAEVLGQSVEVLYSYETRNEHGTALQMALDGKGPPLLGGPPRTIQTVMVTKYGVEVPVEATWRTYEDNAARFFAAIIRRQAQ